ncbi:MAG: hypothetical protein MK181_10480 [Acidimicrobiales bacterium]|nr:hypothetical protein [Acidimicrobiales bacterium]
MADRHLIIPRNHPELPTEHGDFNVQGPSVIPTPDWLPVPTAGPLDRYLLYFAHHRGASIRLATSDHPTGPWRIVSTDVLHVDDVATAIDPTDARRHVASPDVHVDHEARTIRMYFHGHVTEAMAGHLPSWNRYPTMDQHTLAATSDDGLRFRPIKLLAAISPSYPRGFRWDGHWYGLSMPSGLCRSVDGLSGFEAGPSLFQDDEIRHAGVVVVDHELLVWFTRAGDAPERILRTTVDLRGDWSTWSAGPVEEILRPVESWEGAALPVEPTPRGPSFQPQHGLRDPFVIDLSTDDHPEAEGRWLFYAAAGEFSLGVTRLPAAS